MATVPLLECRNLCVSYASRGGDIPAVVDFNLRLWPGESHGLVGESGCGKSTIAFAIMRYLGNAGRIVGGEIIFDGRDMLALDPESLRKIRGADIAMVYQEPMASLNPAMTVGAQLAEVLMVHDGMRRKPANRNALDMLQRVRLADGERLMAAYPHQLSGGQQQRIVIAMALLSKPKLLLLDEPTTALDVTVEAGIVDLVREISAEFGTSMLYISHNLGLILETCDRLTVMYSGEAVEAGAVATVFGQPRHPYTRGLFASLPVLTADKERRPLVPIPGQLPSPRARPAGCNFGPRCRDFLAATCDAGPIPMTSVSTSPPHDTRCIRSADIEWGGADTLHPGQHTARVPGSEVVLRVRDLEKRYGPVRANDGLSFDARRGETLAIVGESGCGKSTFAKILMGLEQADGGTITSGTQQLAALPVAKRAAGTIRDLQMVFQNPFDTLNPSLNIGRQLARVLRKLNPSLDAAAVRTQVLQLLETVKLPRDTAERLPRQLSGGQKQRIGIARAFAGNPAMVLADEPLSALDVSVQAAIAELLMQIQRREQTTLIFISHDLSVVRYLADRILVMYLGKIMEAGTTAAVFAPPYHPYSEALLSAIPIADPTVRKRRIRLSGELSSPAGVTTGCVFATRCAYRLHAVCDQQPPPVHDFGHAHTIACHLPRSTLLDMRPVFN